MGRHSKNSWDTTIRGIAGIDTLPSAGYGIYNFRVNSPVVDKYGKFEISFNLPGVYSNPFDPEVIDVSAVFTAPGGMVMSVPGFFNQNYLRKLEGGKEKLVPVGKSEWKIRFSPRKVGTYTYYLKIKDKEGQITTKKRSFRAVPSDNPGLIMVSKKDSSYFEFSNGDFYYPVGHSVIFPVDKRYGRWYKLPKNQETYNFDRYYTRMGKSGENWSRMWLSSGWLALEWKDGWPGYYGVGRYSLQDAWRLDYVQVGLYSPDTIAAIHRMWGYGKQFDKPVLYSEFGGDHHLGNTPIDFMETSLHSGLWASYMSQLAGSAMFWWWHCVDDNDLYYHLEALSNFVKEEDRRGRNLRQVKAGIIQGEKDNLRVECLKGDAVCYLWIYNPVALNLIRNKSEWHTVNGAMVIAPDIKKGRYKIEFWDTYSGKVMQSQEMTFAGGEMCLRLPSVDKDIACKIKRL